MTLREQQSLHVKLVAQLIAWAFANGYELTWGQTKRSASEAELNAEKGTGIVNSLHCLGLAVDLNLFKNGAWLTNSESFRPLGEYWKSLHPLACWGGDFKTKDGIPKPDGNHFSLTWGGVK